MSKTSKGEFGENIASDYLKEKGYNIIKTNYRSFHGEIDIIASKSGVTVFIEVKYRKTNGFGLGLEAVTQSKIQKIIKTAQNYIEEYNIKTPCRFDVISIDANLINHIENAFSL